MASLVLWHCFLSLSEGVYCNSPSACFVASDGHSLRLYQAVIEAKTLLSELSNPEISVSHHTGYSGSAWQQLIVGRIRQTPKLRI